MYHPWDVDKGGGGLLPAGNDETDGLLRDEDARGVRVSRRKRGYCRGALMKCRHYRYTGQNPLLPGRPATLLPANTRFRRVPHWDPTVILRPCYCHELNELTPRGNIATGLCNLVPPTFNPGYSRRSFGRMLVHGSWEMSMGFPRFSFPPVSSVTCTLSK